MEMVPFKYTSLLPKAFHYSSLREGFRKEGSLLFQVTLSIHVITLSG